MADRRLVNQTELADVMGISTITLRDLIRKNPDFPVEARGDHGVAYEFDIDQVQAWRQQNQADIAAMSASRVEELKQMRLNWAGEPVVDDPTMGLSPTDRRAELDAQRAHDVMAAQRGALLAKSDVDHAVRQALSELTKGLRQVGADLARDHGLSREQRIALDARIRQAMNQTTDKLQPMLADDDAQAA